MRLVPDYSLLGMQLTLAVQSLTECITCVVLAQVNILCSVNVC